MVLVRCSTLWTCSAMHHKNTIYRRRWSYQAACTIKCRDTGHCNWSRAACQSLAYSLFAILWQHYILWSAKCACQGMIAHRGPWENNPFLSAPHPSTREFISFKRSMCVSYCSVVCHPLSEYMAACPVSLTVSLWRMLLSKAWYNLLQSVSPRLVTMFGSTSILLACSNFYHCCTDQHL